jgi:flavin reductase (DIM6/NTAB) family NADH-FMN oxidoreductase RutF
VKGRTSGAFYTRAMSSDYAFNPPPDGIEDRPNSAAGRVLMGGPVALVTTTWRGKSNIIPISWHMPVSSKPSIVAIALGESRYSTEMVKHAQQFAINIPARPLLHHVQYLGTLSGEHVDKFEATQLESFPSQTITAPLIVGCCAWIECQVVEAFPIGDHLLVAGLVTAVRVDPASFDDRWLVGEPETRALHFLAGNNYSTLNGVLEARVPRSAEAPERILREGIAEELELTREARERREEAVGELREEIRRGRAVDPASLDDLARRGIEVSADDLVDLSKGIVLGE